MIAVLCVADDYMPSPEEVDDVVAYVLERGITRVRHGGTRAALMACEKLVAARGVEIEVWEASNYGMGPTASALRNRAMVLGEDRAPAHVLVVFSGTREMKDGSSSVRNCIAVATANRIKVQRIFRKQQTELFPKERP